VQCKRSWRRNESLHRNRTRRVPRCVAALWLVLAGALGLFGAAALMLAVVGAIRLLDAFLGPEHVVGRGCCALTLSPAFGVVCALEMVAIAGGASAVAFGLCALVESWLN
jgi:putative effector of murein hydrolase